MNRDIRKNPILKFNLSALNQIGLVYFDDQRFPTFEYCKGIFSVFSLFIFNITEYIFIILNIKDVNLITLNCATTVLNTTLVAKGATFIWHNKIYFGLITDMHESMKRIENSGHKECNKILNKYVWHAFAVTTTIFIFTTITLFIFSAYIFYMFIIASE